MLKSTFALVVAVAIFFLAQHVSAQVGPTCCPVANPCDGIICGKNKECIPHRNRCSYYCVTVSCPTYSVCPKQPACDGNPCPAGANCLNDCPNSCLHACEISRLFPCKGK